MNDSSFINVLHVSSSDLVGQAFNGFDLSNCINSSGTASSQMAVWIKSSHSSMVTDVHSLVPSLLHRLCYTASCITSSDNMFALGSNALLRTDCFRNASVVHLQLVHAGFFMSPFVVHKISSLRPTVWTMHDMWPLTGCCSQSLDCDKWLKKCSGVCPTPRTSGILRNYTPCLMAAIKFALFRLSRLSLVVASDWMMNKCKQSSWASTKPIAKIPFGVDTEIFNPARRRAARNLFCIDSNELVISFRGISLTSDRFKGTRIMLDALKIISKRRKVTIIVFQDSSSFSHLASVIRVIDVGFLSAKSEIANALAASDVFVMPSYVESFGMMAVEAMACGVPVVASNTGALSEHIRPPNGGMLFQSGDSEQLASCIIQLLDSREKREAISAYGRIVVSKEYTMQQYLEKHLALYSSILT